MIQGWNRVGELLRRAGGSGALRWIQGTVQDIDHIARPVVLSSEIALVLGGRVADPDADYSIRIRQSRRPDPTLTLEDRTTPANLTEKENQ